MKQHVRSLPILLLLFASIAAFGQDAQSAAPAPVPVPVKESRETTLPDNARYVNRPDLLTACRQRVSEADAKKVEILFIGDSITERWATVGKEVWQRYYGDRALNFGVNGDKTQNVLWRMDNLDIKELKPKVAVILIGTNNKSNTTQEIADGVQAVIQKAQLAYPGIRIILVGILPNKRATEKMQDVNAIIRGFADEKTIYFLDLGPAMPAVGDNWKGIGRDYLHPDAEGYAIWASAMQPKLNALLSPQHDTSK